MSVATDMFSMQGRMGPAAFMKSGLILIAIGFVLGLLILVSVSLSVVASLVSLILIWPWVAIWVKRLHDSGKSGWLFLLVLVVYLIAAWCVSLVVTAMFGADLQQATQAAAESGDIGAVFATTMAASRDLALPTAVGNAIVSVVILFLGNVMLRSDPGVNRFGPPPAP